MLHILILGRTFLHSRVQKYVCKYECITNAIPEHVDCHTCLCTIFRRSLQQVKRPEYVAVFVSLRGGGAYPSCNSRSVIICGMR